MPISMSDAIRNMALDEHIFLPKANPQSIKAIVSRIADKMHRRYMTKKDKGGVHIVRLK